VIAPGLILTATKVLGEIVIIMFEKVRALSDMRTGTFRRQEPPGRPTVIFGISILSILTKDADHTLVQRLLLGYSS
jgi:hypothetical protein